MADILCQGPDSSTHQHSGHRPDLWRWADKGMHQCQGHRGKLPDQGDTQWDSRQKGGRSILDNRATVGGKFSDNTGIQQAIETAF